MFENTFVVDVGLGHGRKRKETLGPKSPPHRGPNPPGFLFGVLWLRKKKHEVAAQRVASIFVHQSFGW